MAESEQECGKLMGSDYVYDADYQWMIEHGWNRPEEFELLMSMVSNKDVAIRDLKSLLELAQEHLQHAREEAAKEIISLYDAYEDGHASQHDIQQMRKKYGVE